MKRVLLAIAAGVAAAGLIFYAYLGTTPPPNFDIIIENGVVYDGSGGEGRMVDIGIVGDRITVVGDIPYGQAERVIDAGGKAIAPGFINVLSWATESLLVDGTGESDIRQGVTTEVFGEGWSMGPVNDQMRETMLARQGDLKFEVPWGYFGRLSGAYGSKRRFPECGLFYGGQHGAYLRAWI